MVIKSNDRLAHVTSNRANYYYCYTSVLYFFSNSSCSISALRDSWFNKCQNSFPYMSCPRTWSSFSECENYCMFVLLQPWKTLKPGLWESHGFWSFTVWTKKNACSPVICNTLQQRWGTLILEGHSPAEFSSNPEKNRKKTKTNCILKTLISWFRCVWLGLELNSAGTPALQDQRSPPLHYRDIFFLSASTWHCWDLP